MNQNVVNGMVEEGLIRLTGAASAAGAWRILLPSYQSGERIAIKINLNNAGSCGDGDTIIDALMQPINAVIRSLVSAGIGVQAGDITVYDAVRPMPARLYSQRQYTQAHYMATSCGDRTATFDHVDPSLRVSFTNPAMKTTRYLTDLLSEATYLINMPIIKRHSTAPVTLGFKHHFGSLSDLGGSGDDNPHVHINPSNSHYHSTYSPLVDIYSNPNIAGKTVLTLGDGLFGAPNVNDKPAKWTKTFGGAPNSLFFSRDPVAIDCVMIGWLNAEWGVVNAAYDYLRLAEQAGLGTFEKGDPVSDSYTRIDYARFDL